MWQCCLSTDPGRTGQSKSPRDVRSRAHAKHADRSRADRTTPVRLIHKHQKQITKLSNHQSTSRISICGGEDYDAEMGEDELRTIKAVAAILQYMANGPVDVNYTEEALDMLSGILMDLAEK